LARKTKRNRFSKKVVSGLAFICTSLIGGFISSVGSDLYHTIRNAFSFGFPLSLPQVIFLIIGIAGLILMISGFSDNENVKGRAKEKKARYFSQ